MTAARKPSVIASDITQQQEPLSSQKPASFPSAFAVAATFMVPSTEQDDVREWFDGIMKTCPYDHVKTSIECQPAQVEGTRWGPQRLFIPHRSGIVKNATPLIKSDTVLRWSQQRWWTPVVAGTVFVAMTMLGVASWYANRADIYNSLVFLGSIMLSGALGVYMSTYSRDITKHVVTSFDFWYLALQAIGLFIVNTIWVWRHTNDDYLSHPIRILGNCVAMTALLCMDASNASRQMKGLVMAVTSLGFIAALVAWVFDTTAPGMYELTVFGFKTPIKTLAVTFLAVLAAFSSRFATTCLFLRDDAIMLKFTPRWVRLDSIEVVPKWHSDLGDMYITDRNHINNTGEEGQRNPGGEKNDHTENEELKSMDSLSMPLTDNMEDDPQQQQQQHQGAGGDGHSVSLLPNGLINGDTQHLGEGEVSEEDEAEANSWKPKKNRRTKRSVSTASIPGLYSEMSAGSNGATTAGGEGPAVPIRNGGESPTSNSVFYPPLREPSHKLLFRLEFRISRWYTLHRRQITKSKRSKQSFSQTPQAANTEEVEVK